MKDKIIECIEMALSRAGYQVMDGDADSVIIRDKNLDQDFEVKVTEFN